MSRLSDNSSPEGERGDEGVREDFVSAVTPLKVWCPSVVDTQIARATPFWSQVNCGFTFHPVQKLRECLEFTLALLPGSFVPSSLGVLKKSHRLVRST